ncbi:MAG TPA: hypothetical protein VF131_01260 [Blastocatellia bacterium]|nr:hypothetical protein [Blastocatellia bacterium]
MSEPEDQRAGEPEKQTTSEKADEAPEQAGDVAKSETHRPALVITVGGQKRVIPVTDLLLQSGKRIPAQFTGWERRKLDMSGPDGQQSHIKLVEQYGFPLDLTCFFFLIDGEGLGEPDYLFQFTGVEDNGSLHTLATTAQPFILNLPPQGRLRLMVGYIWQNLVLLKSQSRDKSFCAETHNGTILSVPPHWRQQVVDTHIRSHIPPDARLAEMKRLMHGYELMRRIWADVGTRNIKYTEQEAQQASQKIIADAEPHIKNMAYATRDELSIQKLAKKMKKSRQTFYDIDTACLFYGQRGLFERLKEMYRQERKRIKR